MRPKHEATYLEQEDELYEAMDSFIERVKTGVDLIELKS